MKRIKAYKYRIYPTKKQQELFEKTFGCVRFLWNKNIECFNSFDSENEIEFKSSTELRKDFEFLKEVSAAALQQKEKDFKEYKNNFFKKVKEGKSGKYKANFKSKNLYNKYRLPNQKFSIVENRIRLEKVGYVKFIEDRVIPLDSKMLSITISKNNSNQYFASVSFETEVKIPERNNRKVGIDLGLKMFATQSDNMEIENPRFLINNHDKIKKLQKALSRKQKGSNRREKCRLKLAKEHQKVSNKREYFLHNYTTFLVRNYDFIAIEDLGVSNMLKNRKLSKSISDVSWSKFRRILTYKCNWFEKELVVVDRYYASSKTCTCGVKNESLELKDRIWACSSCGCINDRDLLASKNILKEAIRIKTA